MSTAAATAAAPTFADVARRVHVWVTLRRWLSVLRMTFIPATLVLVLLMLSLLRGAALMVTPWIGLALWLAGSLAYSWWRRPGEYSALALWDQAAGRREAFASAWWFEQRAEGGEIALLHVASQRAALPLALPSLKRDLPLRPDRWLALPLAVAIIGSFVSIVTAPPNTDVFMDAEMSRKAAEVAQKLAQTDWEKKKLQGLTEDETKQVENLKQKLQKTAEDLAKAAGKDARSVLADLERRARDAEKLADEMGKGKEAWASEKMVEALRQHADTADLGDAVAAKNAKAAGKAAETLAAALKAPQITGEAKQRLNETLQDTQKQAEAEDRKRTVGQNVLAAGDQLQQGSAAGAGEEFQKLADKLRDMDLRDQARKELQQLAQQLRDSASSIAGQEGQQGAMQQMSQAGQSGQQPEQGEAPQVGQASGQQQQQMLNPPGMGQGQQNQMQQPPQPGNGQGQGQPPPMMGQGPPGQQGKPGQPAEGQPMLLAPVPGAPKMDPKAPVLIMEGQSPPDQPGSMVSVPMSGGQQAGVGQAELNNTPTQKQQSGKEDMVQAQQNAQGQSTVRSVEGGPRTEKSGRTATQTALDAIQAEEAALDESPLPPARREQVRRYFNELRKRFEKE